MGLIKGEDRKGRRPRNRKISLGHDAEIRVEKILTDDRTRLNASATIKDFI